MDKKSAGNNQNKIDVKFCCEKPVAFIKKPGKYSEDGDLHATECLSCPVCGNKKNIERLLFAKKLVSLTYWKQKHHRNAYTKTKTE